MRSQVKLFSGIIFIWFCILYAAPPVWADDQERPEVKVAFTDDHSIILHRLLYEALKRSGYQMVGKATGMRTAVADVNYGDAAVLPTQTTGWDERYPNLIKVPVAIDNVEYTAYALSASPYKFSAWGDLAGLRIGYRWQNEYVANNVSRTGSKNLIVMDGPKAMWSALLSGEADVVILPRMSHFEYRLPEGLKKAGVLERQPVYTYVNKNYANLATLLENAYQQMFVDGAIEKIHNNHSLSGGKKIILHINSYNTQNENEHKQMEAIRESLKLNTAYEYYSFNLNSNEPHSQASFSAVISDLIRTEFTSRYSDLVIASGNEALDFVLDNYYLLFPGNPVLFFDVQGFNRSMIHGLEDRVTGVSESVSFYETASKMLRLYPGTRQIFILNDYALSNSLKLRADIQASLKTNNLPVKVVFSENKPFPDILEDIRGLEPDTLVLIGNYLSDSDNSLYSKTYVQKLVTEASGNPVFSLTASNIGHGTLGGLVAPAGAMSSLVASMAVDILKGKSPADIPIILDSSPLHQWHFDYNVAKRFNIGVKNLPAGHFIVNRSLPIWESNPLEFKLMLAVVTLSLMAICGLMAFLKILSKKRAEATAASKAKSVFLAHMSHEIRTPMNAIIGMTDLALRVDLPGAAREYIYTVKQASVNLLSIINNILDFSKIETGKLEITAKAYQFSSLLNDVIGIIRMRIIDSPVTFTVNADCNIPDALVGDETRIRQILINLLGNAAKFTEEGFVSLSVHGEMTDKDMISLVLKIKDSGRGIRPEDIAVLFTEYTQVDTEKNKIIEGVGLGLSITHNLVKVMGGDISVESEYGQGSSFTVTLPQRIHSPEKMAVLKNPENKTVLLYEHRKIHAKSIAAAIHNLGGQCTAVASESELSEKLSNHAFPFIFIHSALYESCNEIISNFGSNSKTVLLVEFGGAIPAKGLRVLSMPAYSISIANILNDVSDSYLYSENSEKIVRFIAPEARVLVVDDIDTNLLVAQGLLLPYKMKVDFRNSGQKAIEAIQSNKYDVVFMDYKMPEMDGLEATQRIREMGGQDSYYKNLPIIALTANAVIGFREMLLKNGFDDYLSKPIDTVKLNLVLERMLPKQKQKKIGL